MTSPIATISGVLDLLRDHVPSVAHYPALATASPEGIACARLVVLRGMHPSKRWIWFNTHAKARKVAHLRAHPHAELALWIPERGIQLRVLAKYQILTAKTRSHDLQDLRAQSWREQPAQSRALYAKNAPPASEKIGPPHPDFVVLLGLFDRIDALQLTEPCHTQYVHTWQGQGQHAHWQTTKMTA